VKRVVTQLWKSERGLSAMLVFLCLALFIGMPLYAMRSVGEIVFGVLFSLILITGAAGIAGNRRMTAGVVVLTVGTLALRWASVENPESPVRIWSLVLSIVLLSIFAYFVLVQVFRDGPITSYRIQGAIIVYLLVGLTWSAAYELVYHLAPVSFAFAQSPRSGGPEAQKLVYFSFVTLTTLGYGDVTPLHPMARSLAIAEALVGQLYPSILIARLVSMELESRRRG
jgi:hypothetical protein